MANRGRHKKKPSKYPNTWLTKVLTESQIDLIFERARRQGNRINTRMIEVDPESTQIMIWDETPEGYSYWYELISKIKNFKRLYYSNGRC